ncbi:MAG: hypothetical protein Q4E35_06505 [Eubacteriales bacterium]|nr:hypothetical protein [Eubacteriales bacterium]
MRPYGKDILRTIRGEKKRLLALITIAALGVTMMTGLKASCDDLRASADAFFDAQSLHDISVVSTLGLKDADIEALAALDNIECAEGEFSEKVQLDLKDGFTEALFRTFTPDGIDRPYVIEGRLPEKLGETAVTNSYMTVSGKRIGDTVSIREKLEETEEDGGEEIEGFEDLKEEEKPNFPITEFTITGIVTDVTAVVNPDGSTGFRNAGAEDYTAFVTWDSVESDYYTAVNLTVKGAKATDCFSREYTALIDAAKQDIETLVKENRQRAGYKAIRDEAERKINDAEKKADEKFADARQELDDAEKELRDGKIELDYGEVKLALGIAEAKAEIAEGRALIEEKNAELEDGIRQLDEASAELEAQEAALNENEAALKQSAEQLAQGRAQLDEAKQLLQSQENETLNQLDIAIAHLEGAIAMLDPASEGYAQQLAELQGALSGLQSQKSEAQQLFAGEWEKISSQEQELNANEMLINEGLASIEEGRAQIAEGRTQLEEKYAEAEAGRIELNEAQSMLIAGEKTAEEKLLQGLKELEDGKKEYADGEKEYADGVKEYEEKRIEAAEKLREAREELSDIPECVWYVRDRNALNGCADIKSDADCIESIGTIFPIMFLLVAVLISLTTINRMVDENRGQIGTYQALGFRDREIRRKFAVYSSVASLTGGILGNVCGFVVLPEIIIVIFRQMYLLPEYALGYDLTSGLGGILLFYAAIVGTTVVTVSLTVKKMPAVLMRPKAPKAGSRILLEYITPIWRSMSFLNKVTARNLFRYKKRFLMTVFGIAGCTGLLLCGFSIRDTVADLLPRQYEQIISYDILAATAGDGDFDALTEYLAQRGSEIRQSIAVAVSDTDVHGVNGETLTVQLYVLPDGADISPYFTLRNMSGESVTLSDEGFVITENIGTFLGFAEGDQMSIQDMELREAVSPIVSITENYLGNSIFITQSEYERLFDEFSPNAVLLCLEDGADDYAMRDDLNRLDEVQSVTSVRELKDSFHQSFLLMNMVVYVVIVLAGALAFAVLFTLSATNISERDREIATVKVLGFFDGEVHTYINKETLILTLLGIAAGLPLGVYLGRLLGKALQMPAIVFRTVIHPVSYVFSGGITFIFALIVNIMTNRMIDKIDPIEALKCVE